MSIPKFQPITSLSQDTKNKLKPVFGILIVLLLAAFGLEAKNTDVSLNKLVETKSLTQSVLTRDAAGNLNFKRDASGKFLTENCQKDLYNCSNFKTQKEAMEVFQNCGGKGDDVNGLDGDKDGKPCEDLPVGK